MLGAPAAIDRVAEAAPDAREADLRRLIRHPRRKTSSGSPTAPRSGFLQLSGRASERRSRASRSAPPEGRMPATSPRGADVPRAGGAAAEHGVARPSRERRSDALPRPARDYPPALTLAISRRSASSMASTLSNLSALPNVI